MSCFMLGGLASATIYRQASPFCPVSLGVVLNLRSGRVWRPESAFQFADKWITFHDAGFSVARIWPPSTVTPFNGAGFTRSAASLVFVARRSS